MYGGKRQKAKEKPTALRYNNNKTKKVLTHIIMDGMNLSLSLCVCVALASSGLHSRGRCVLSAPVVVIGPAAAETTPVATI